MDIPFEHAIIRFSCLQSQEHAPTPRLVFASIELLPRTRSEPDSTLLENSGFPPHIKTKVGRLFFRRVGLRAKEALDWYRCLNTLPDPEENFAQKGLETGELTDEPNWRDELWQSLTTPIPPPMFPGPLDDDRVDPFTGANREILRIHRRLSARDTVIDRLGEDGKVVEWLKRRVWVDFKLYPELLGSAVLIVPDPDIKHVKMRLDRDADNDGAALLAQVVPRSVMPSGLHLLLTEERHGGVVWQELFTVSNNGVVKAKRPQPIDKVSYALIHDERGVLATQPPVGFLRAISVNSSMLGRELRLHSPDGRGKRASNSTRSVKHASISTFTTGKPMSPVGKMAEGRERRRAARHKGTEFLLRNPTLARDKLWEIIGSAQKTIMIVDPYADGLDLQQYGLASSGAQIRLLSAQKTTESRDVVELAFGLKHLQDAELKAEVRVMPARAIHDRFIIADETIWSLGSSLNGLGNEATMLIRLREPQPIREELEKLWTSSRTIEVEL